MTGLIAENWNTFGDDIDLALDGIWSARGSNFGIGSPETTLEIPSWEEDGQYWLKMDGRGAGMRRGFPTGAQSAVGVCETVYLPELPNLNDRGWLMDLRDGSNASIAKMKVTTDGNLTIHNSAGTQIAATAAPVITAGAAIKIQAQFTFHATLGEVEVRINGVAAPVINATGLVMDGSCTQIFFGNNDTSVGPNLLWYQQFMAVYSLTGTYNDDFPNITGVATVYPAADTVDAGFTPRPRQIIDAGVLIVPGSASVLDCAASADYDLGSADFTLECFYRPVEPVTGSNFGTLLGKWSASTSKRSYRLVQYGPDTNGGQLRFEITTDGTLATLQTILAVTYPFQVGVIYDIAVVRESGQTRLYIDGRQVGLDQPDAFTYYASTTLAKFTVGGEMSGVGSSVLSNSSVNAIFDEVRITPGVARYDSNYTPTTIPYPRSAPSDPDFADVVLLAGFDEGITDESDAAHTLTARGSTARLVPDDGAAAYQTVNPTAPLDDRYLEAALVSATGILTLTANPANGNQVVLGSQTYTYNTVLGGADSVLIGADEEESIANLVAAINGDAGEGTLYGTGTTPNADATAEAAPTSVQLTATAITPGTAGNSIISTETITGGSWTGATLAGGAEIPAPSRFTLSRLDPTVTGVRWIEMRNRSYVVGGDGSLQLSFQVDGDDAPGADNALTSNPTYRFDVIEEDPHTAAALTPTSIVNGSVVLERTA